MDFDVSDEGTSLKIFLISSELPNSSRCLPHSVASFAVIVSYPAGCQNFTHTCSSHKPCLRELFKLQIGILKHNFSP